MKSDTEKKVYSGSTTSVFPDRLLTQSKKVIYFRDIVSITAIPCLFRSSAYSNESDVDYFIEILTSDTNKHLLNQGEHNFIQAFQTYRHVSFNYLLTVDDVLTKFSWTKYFFTSLLFELSPLRIVLWTGPQQL